MTIPAAPVNPWMKRSNIKIPILVVKASASDATTYIPRLNINGFFLPLISLRGPNISCPVARPIRHVVRLICTSDAVVLKSSATTGSAGRYMSIDIGPIAVNAPSSMTIQYLLSLLLFIYVFMSAAFFIIL